MRKTATAHLQTLQVGGASIGGALRLSPRQSGGAAVRCVLPAAWCQLVAVQVRVGTALLPE
ncbi:hypothetical protein Kpho02_04960 [Kitasatospora phosalacinea]|uniref:Uncharacterized protein n=1 Tax=Kitasatospora phosalacinea TaxID=2065 RepID=A0A9W6Q1Z2_9ACTN|nr:hypothetical protein Kpho02_04960 [Kitasatospora phosalacinea]